MVVWFLPVESRKVTPKLYAYFNSIARGTWSSDNEQVNFSVYHSCHMQCCGTSIIFQSYQLCFFICWHWKVAKSVPTQIYPTEFETWSEQYSDRKCLSVERERAVPWTQPTYSTSNISVFLLSFLVDMLYEVCF